MLDLCFVCRNIPVLAASHADVAFLCILPTARYIMAIKWKLTSSGAVKSAGSNPDEQAQHLAFPAQTRKWLRVDDKGKTALVKVTEQAGHCRLPPCFPWHCLLAFPMGDVVHSPLKLTCSGLTPTCCLLCATVEEVTYSAGRPFPKVLPALAVLLRQRKLILLPQVIARESAVPLGLYQGGGEP